MQMVTKTKFVIACAVAALCGCTVGPDYYLSEVAVPVSYGSTWKAVVTQDELPQPEILRWWHSLHDRELNRLVERAVACNPDIEIALTRVQAFRTQEIVVIGNALPQVGGKRRHRCWHRNRYDERPPRAVDPRWRCHGRLAALGSDGRLRCWLGA